MPPDPEESPAPLALDAFRQGKAWMAEGRLTEAATAFRQAAHLEPDNARAHGNLAIVLWENGRREEGLAAFRQAARLAPDNPLILNNLGRCLQESGASAEALIFLDRAVSASPEDPRCRFNRALALLQAGRFSEGWREYEWRWREERFQAQRRPFSQPLWNGGALGPKQTLLLHAEQGFGDAIQFARFAALARQRGCGCRILLESPPALRRLFQCVPGVDAVVARGAPLPRFDQHIPLLSLPHVLQTGGAFPFPDGYLRTSVPSPLLRTRERLAIGLAWRGEGLGRFDTERNLPLERLAPIVTQEGVEAVSLQVGGPNADLARFPWGKRVRVPALCDFAATAALIQDLDLVITIDSVIAHLAGALGKPVWTLLAFAPEWRWGLSGERSDWYGSMRLFRQPVRGDWDSVFREVASRLGQRRAR